MVTEGSRTSWSGARGSVSAEPEHQSVLTYVRFDDKLMV